MQRVLFGLSAVFSGVIALMWHDPQTWQGLVKIWTVPFGVTIGTILMIAQIAGGIGIQVRRIARAASIVLIVVYAAFALASIPEIMAHPAVYQGYGSFFEQFTPLCAALALYGLNVRIGMGLCAIAFGLEQAFYLHATAGFVPRWIPPNPMFWAVLTTVAFLLAGIALLINWRARLATLLMALMIILFGVLVWVPIIIAHPHSHFSWSELALTFLIAGAAWLVADSLPVRKGR